MIIETGDQKLSALVTGAEGFVGRHLLGHLAAENRYRLWAMTRRTDRTGGFHVPGVEWVTGDLLDRSSLHEALRKTRPARVFHLAGQSVVSESWKSPEITFAINVQGQVHLFESLRELGLNPRILVAGSSEEYGDVTSDGLPVREDTPLHPLSPYAVSKVAQDLMAYQYFRSYGFPAVRTRAFNHTGPGRPDAYAISSFAKQIASIEVGLAPAVLQVGNLDARRDYLDVRDVVRAYGLAIEKGEAGQVYNLCSGHARSMKEILNQLLELTSSRIEIRVDPARLRPSDLPIIYGNPSRFQNLTGWKPLIPFRQTLQDLLDDWRKKVRAVDSSPDALQASPRGNA